MSEQLAEEKIKALIEFVDANLKHRKIGDVFRILLPAVLVLIMLFFIVFLMIYQWTNLPLLNWTPGVVSIIAIIIAFNSYVQSSVQSFNKRIVLGIYTKKLRERLADKSEEAFCVLVPLVALKKHNYPMKLSVLYDINRDIFKPEKLTEYFYLN